MVSFLCSAGCVDVFACCAVAHDGQAIQHRTNAHASGSICMVESEPPIPLRILLHSRIYRRSLGGPTRCWLRQTNAQVIGGLLQRIQCRWA